MKLRKPAANRVVKSFALNAGNSNHQETHAIPTNFYYFQILHGLNYSCIGDGHSTIDRETLYYTWYINPTDLKGWMTIPRKTMGCIHRQPTNLLEFHFVAFHLLGCPRKLVNV